MSTLIASPAPVATTVNDITLTPSGRFVRVCFAPVRLPGAFARHPRRAPWAVDSPLVASTLMSLEKLLCKDIRIGDRVQLTLEGTIDRPTVARVLLECREVPHA